MTPTYSLLTTVYDTDAEFFLPLAQSLLRLPRQDFEWVLLDNGSSSSGTLKALEMVGRDPRVKLGRVPENLGIIGGMAHVFAQATGDFILPLDSDDLLADGFFDIIDRARSDFPDVDAFYSDEARFMKGRIHDTYQKPAFDPLFLLHSCYIAHLCIFRRDLAAEVGVYTDFDAQGSHDWDTYVRFMNAGARIRRIERTLYFWRMHEGSTSLDISSKSYIESSHMTVLNKWIKFRDLEPEVALRKSSHWELPGNWEFCATRSQPNTTISIERITDQSIPENAAWVSVQANGVDVSEEAVQDTIATMRLFDDIGLAGGGTRAKGRWIDGPRYAGNHWVFSESDVGDPGYFGRTFKPHGCSLISSQFVVLRRDCFDAVKTWLETSGHAFGNLPIQDFALLASFWVARRCLRSIYHPNLNTDLVSSRTPKKRSGLVAALGQGLTTQIEKQPASGFEFAAREVSSAIPPISQILMQDIAGDEVDAEDVLQGQALVRAADRSAGLPPGMITVITSVYINTPAHFFAELAQCVRDQTPTPASWIVVRNGPIQDGVEAILRDLGTLDWVHILDIAENDGIAPALRLAIDAVESPYFTVVDADDLMVPDAIASLTQFASENDLPEVIYSDECTYSDDEPQHLYCREGFDPILHADSSTIWHMIIVRKDALDLEKLLSVPATQWATDWEIIANALANPGARVLHFAHALYLWRQHGASISNNETGDDRSVLSQKAVLETYICAPGMQPEVWPESRGSVEMYATAPLSSLDHLVHMTPDQFLALEADGLSGLGQPGDMIVLSALNIRTATADFYQEMQRLFLLHPALDAVTGHVVTADGAIISSPELWHGAWRYQPWFGQSKTTSGPFAILQKPRTVSRIVAANAAFPISMAPKIHAELIDPVTALNVAWSPLLCRECVYPHAQ